MAINIVNSLLNSANPLLGPLANYLGASEETVKSALSAALPALLGGLMQKAATPQGASDVFQWITSSDIDTGVLSDAGAPISPDRAGALISLGNSLLGKVLGGKTEQVTDAIGAAAGLKAPAAGSVLALAAPLMFGFLKQQVTANKLGASGLVDLLMGQKSFLATMGLDGRIARALGFSSLSSLLDAVPSVPAAAMHGVKAAATGAGAAAAAAASAGGGALRRGWPWLVGAALAALVYFGFMRPEGVRAPAESPPVAAVSSAVTEGAGLHETVYFEVGEASLRPEAQSTIVAIAERISRDNVAIKITGYADSTGDAARNADLAKERAKAVRDALLAAGVADSSIHLQPPANITGSGSDLAARRVEIAQVD